MILGIDEVGRGSWAGPLVVGAVVLGGANIDGLTDSKKLTKKSRENLDIEIRNKAKAYGLGWVDPKEIDEIGLSKALKLATLRAIENIKLPYNQIIIDGTVNFLIDTDKAELVTTIKKADLLVPCVSAASIIAKVARDNYMKSQNETYFQYGFSENVGYGTKRHIKSIEEHGVSPLHRLSFKPLKHYKSDSSTTTSIGRRAEGLAADFLIKKGHKIIERNWRNKYCEIDIVSKLGDKLYFNEVKYRKDSSRGGGFEAVDTKKLNKMQFAAKIYVNSKEVDYNFLRLSVISVSGLDPKVDDWLEL